VEAHEEVQVAVRRVEVRPDGGSEKLDAMHAVAETHALQFLALFLDQAVHGVLIAFLQT
jgi:hypothetical protein